ncbi:hypothetical protein VTG60DRAFT_3692 [Thermothelomyces hinnuleus]
MQGDVTGDELAQSITAFAVPSNQIPQKDANGKFPCPHCTKTYLHAKHLKRHLLRHTGEKLYMCILCRDPFDRSDVLKRHFIKCAERRGNPTSAIHLSNPEAFLNPEVRYKKYMEQAAARQRPIGTDGDVGYGGEIATTMQVDPQLPDYSTSQNSAEVFGCGWQGEFNFGALPCEDDGLLQESHSELAHIAAQFAAKIPPGKFSQAEIQGFLLMRKNTPWRALAEVDGWVQSMLETKQLGTNVLRVQ